MSKWPALPGGDPAASDGVAVENLQDFVPLSGGRMTGPLDMGGQDMPNLGKFWSDNWDGAIPPDLSGGEDGAATTGVAYDGAAGAIQALAFYGAVAPPTGMVSAFGGSSAPSAWLLCDGTAVSRTTYAPLFAVVGTTYGVGDGSTTFNLPDLQQKFPMGKSGAESLGDTGGSFDHTHTGPSHTHAGGSHSHSHTHTFSDTSGGPSSTAYVNDDPGATEQIASRTHTHYVSGTTSSNAASGSATTGAAGTGATGSNNPPYQVLNYIIKT
jgi:microcystin-dependent protein